MRTTFYWGAALTFGLVACGGTTESPSNGAPAPAASASATPSDPSPTPSKKDADASAPTPSPTTTPTSVACNGLVDDGPVATAHMVATNAPPATGGTIADGKYHLAEIALYTGANGSAGALPLSVSTTFVVQGTSVHATAHGPTAGEYADAISTSGTTITFTEICPTQGKSSEAQFSATGSELTIFMKNDLGQIAASRYVRVP